MLILRFCSRTVLLWIFSINFLSFFIKSFLLFVKFLFIHKCYTCSWWAWSWSSNEFKLRVLDNAFFCESMKNCSSSRSNEIPTSLIFMFFLHPNELSVLILRQLFLKMVVWERRELLQTDDSCVLLIFSKKVFKNVSKFLCLFLLHCI